MIVHLSEAELHDIVKNAINEVLITEMAATREQIKKKALGLSAHIAAHWVLVTYFRDNTEIDEATLKHRLIHWQDEIKVALVNIGAADVKSRNKNAFKVKYNAFLEAWNSAGFDSDEGKVFSKIKNKLVSENIDLRSEFEPIMYVIRMFINDTKAMAAAVASGDPITMGEYALSLAPDSGFDPNWQG